jgi:hypothetical protein
MCRAFFDFSKDLVLYGLRTFFYAALAATDPVRDRYISAGSVHVYHFLQSFLRGLRVLRKSHSSQLSGFHAATRDLGVLSTTQGGFPGAGIVSSIGSGRELAVHLELQPIRHTDDGVEYEFETGQTTKRSSFYDDGRDGKVARGEGDDGPMGGIGTGMRMGTVRTNMPGGIARADGLRWEEPREERGGVEEEARASREFTRQI